MKTVLHTNNVQPFVYKCALHFEKTRLHKTLSLMRALRVHENSTMVIDAVHRGRGRWHTVRRIDKWAQTFKVIIVNDGLYTGVWGRRQRHLSISTVATDTCTVDYFLGVGEFY